MTRKLPYATMLVVSSLLLPLCPAGAAILSLTDGNSSSAVDTGSGGMTNWTVDGVNQLSQQSFWFRVGAAGGETALGSLALGVASLSDTNNNSLADTLYLPYLGGSFKVEVTYVLRGGTAGSGTSDIAESITITNTGATSLDFHFFQYTNLHLNGQTANDSVQIEFGRIARQTNGTTNFSETVTVPGPSRYEAGLASNISSSLQDVSPTALSNVAGPIGPGDLAWAFQWDMPIAPGGSYQISKDKYLAVPEPATMSLLALGGLALLRRRRKMRAV